MKIKKKIIRKEIAEVIYYALQNWDMNPYTKQFAEELSKTIMTRLYLKPIIL